MHPFPSSERLQFLLSDEPCLTQIVVNPYGLTLILDNGCSVVAESALRHISPSKGTTAYSAEWRNEAPITFHALLERRLLVVEASEWELTLSFEGDEALVVHSDDSGYEAGQIYGDPSGALIVF